MAVSTAQSTCHDALYQMGVFHYQAMNTVESRVRGTVTADTIQQARRQLREQGLIVQRIREQTAGRGSRFLLAPGSASRQWDQSVDELAMLLQAGVPLLEALATLVTHVSGKLHSVLEAVRDQVASGSSLADAMRQYPQVFDLVSVQLVEVGENTGELDLVLAELAAFKQRTAQLKDQLTTLLIYPSFVLVLGISAAVFLMTNVMPPLLDSLRESLVELPWPTRIAQSLSEFLVTYGLWMGSVGVPLLAGVVVLLRRPQIRKRIDLASLQLPFVGELILKQSLARVVMVISTMSRSGIPLTRSFELAAMTCKNLSIQHALQQCAQLVKAGKNIPEALRESLIFPPLLLQIFATGEEAGRLEELLDKLSADYSRQVNLKSARFAALLEPALIVFLATFIGFLMLAIILPILEAGNVVQ